MTDIELNSVTDNPLIFLGEFLPEHGEKAEELGGTLAALISS